MTEREDRVESEPPFQPSYELSPEESTILTRKLLATPNVANVPEKYRYVAVAVDGDSEFSNLGRNVERMVLDEEFENDAEEMHEEYGPFEQSSRFYISIDREKEQPSGVLRVIGNSSVGFKTLQDAQRKPFFANAQVALGQAGMDDMDTVQDVGTIAVPREYRRREGPVSILLERAMYIDALERGVTALISIVDHKPLIKLKSRWRGVGIPFARLGKSKAGPYLGSKKSHAVHGYVPEFYEKMSKHRESLRGRLLAKFVLGDALDRLVEGTEDDAIVLHP